MYWCYECECLVSEPDEYGCCPNCGGELEKEEEYTSSYEDLKALAYEEEWRERKVYERITSIQV